jgi:hypothetical protein
MKMDVALALTVILNAVKDLLYVFDPLETDNKQILHRGVYPEHGRRAPQNDIATSPQGDRRQSPTSIFEGVFHDLKLAPQRMKCPHPRPFREREG